MRIAPSPLPLSQTSGEEYWRRKHDEEELLWHVIARRPEADVAISKTVRETATSQKHAWQRHDRDS